MVKYSIGLKALLQQSISDPIFYGDVVENIKRIVGKPNLSDQFKKIINRYIKVGYNLGPQGFGDLERIVIYFHGAGEHW